MPVPGSSNLFFTTCEYSESCSFALCSLPLWPMLGRHTAWHSLDHNDLNAESKLWANFTPLPSRLPAHPDKIHKFVKLSNQDFFWLALILFAFVCQLWLVLVLCKAPWHHANLSYCCYTWCIPQQGACLRSWQVWPSAKARLEMIGHCLQFKVSLIVQVFKFQLFQFLFEVQPATRLLENVSNCFFLLHTLYIAHGYTRIPLGPFSPGAGSLPCTRRPSHLNPQESGNQSHTSETSGCGL